MNDTVNREPETIEKPTRLEWCIALFFTPIFFVIGLSVSDGFPEAGYTKSRAALLLFSCYPVASELFKLISWHLREYFQQPIWWTGQRQNEIGQALLIAIVWGTVWAWPDASTWTWITKSSGYVLLVVIPAFLLVISVDWAFKQIGRMVFFRKKR